MSYIIFVDINYYPYVEGIYDSLREAEKVFKKYNCYEGNVYLCSIIDEKESGE